LQSWHTTHKLYCHIVALHESGFLQTDTYYSERVYISSEMKPSFITKQNECGVYFPSCTHESTTLQH